MASELFISYLDLVVFILKEELSPENINCGIRYTFSEHYNTKQEKAADLMLRHISSHTVKCDEK